MSYFLSSSTLHVLNLLHFSHAYKTIKYHHFPSPLFSTHFFHLASSPQNSIDFSTQLNLSMLIKLINFQVLFSNNDSTKTLQQNENIKNAFNCNQTTLACCANCAECLKRVSIIHGALLITAATSTIHATVHSEEIIENIRKLFAKHSSIITFITAET